ncbi:hypothetical protein D3248_02920 [Leucobacter zeae]|nr:hypothetical protein [Leucobacter zeae]
MQVAQKTDGGSAPHRGSQEYPQDRFDRVERTGRVGAHRVTPRPRYVWQYLIAALLGFALLTAIGIVVVQSEGGSGKLSQLTQSKSSTSAKRAAAAEVDPDATLAILNGTEIPNLAATLEGIVTQEKWGQILFSGSASTADVKISAVFYRDPADAGAAAALAAKLGGLSTYTTEEYTEYDVQLIVLLGSDYRGPGLEEAKAAPQTTPPVEGEDGAISGESAAGADGAVEDAPVE